MFGKEDLKYNRVNIIKNAINTNEFSYNELVRQRMREELKLEDNLIIGHVGAFMPVKNHEFIINIFMEIKKINNNSILLLAGSGELEDKIKCKVKQLGLEDSIKFLGRRNDINSLMQAFDIFLMPSKFEGVPLVGVEAQTSGLPCFFSSSITKEIKIIRDSFFIDLELGAKYWAKIIVEFYKKNIDRDRSIYIKDVVESGYDIKESVKKIEEVYKNYMESIEVYREGED